MSSVFKAWYKGFDVFGQSFAFTYKGEETFKTMFGATATYVILIILIYFAVIQARILINR